MKQPSIGDKIKYGAYGECVITDVRKESIGGKEREFFILSQCNSSSTIFVPVEKATAFKEIRNALTIEEIKALSSATCAIDWSADDKTRNVNFKDVFERDDISEIAGMLLGILSRQKKLKSEKKKLRSTDLNAMKICEKILFDEFSRTIDLRLEDVSLILKGEYIL